MRRDQEPVRAVWPPEPGYFRVRLVKGGPQVPARISRNGETWSTVIAGVLSVATDPIAAGADYIWHYGTRIGETEYREMLFTTAIASADHPARNPRQPIDISRLKPLKP